MPLPPTGGKAVKLFSKKSKVQTCAVQTTGKSAGVTHPFSAIERYSPLSDAELELYSSLREAVPVIDAAIGKIVRLMGTFEVKAQNFRAQKVLDEFTKNVQVSGGLRGLANFVYAYLDQLLTYGTAVGEIVPTSDMRQVGALYNASLKNVAVLPCADGLSVAVCKKDAGNTPFEKQEYIISTLLSPEAGSAKGNSILKGLPFVSSVLLKVFSAVGSNWERAGNIRYAITYKPTDSTQAGARQRAAEIAREWSKAMRDDRGVCDFVAVGDVSIKVIGSDGQILDCDVPIRHMLEQIVSKLCIPPFLLGLSWSSTERMSSVQTDILTSELEYFRTLLTPVIERICRTHLLLFGEEEQVCVEWSNISLQDETELARARLLNAQAKQIEDSMEVNT